MGPQTLKLEAGKYYRTQDGRKAFVAFIGETPFKKDDGETAIVILGEDLGEAHYPWANGRISKRADLEDPLDLVAEWVEPKRITGWLAFSSKDATPFASFVTHLHHTKEEAELAYGGDASAVIFIDVLEGEGLSS